MYPFLGKRGLCAFVFVAVCCNVWIGSTLFAQVGIGTPTPNANSALEINSSTRGFLPPRLTTAQRTTLGGTLAAADEGMLVYDIGVDSIYVWRGSSWRALASTAPAAASIGNGTVVNQTLRWNGSAWVANTGLQASADFVSIGSAIVSQTRLFINYSAAPGGSVGVYTQMSSSAATGNVYPAYFDLSQSSAVAGTGVYSRLLANAGATGHSRSFESELLGAGTGTKTAYFANIGGGGVQVGANFSLTGTTGTTAQTGLDITMATGGANVTQRGQNITMTGTTTSGSKIGSFITVSDGGAGTVTGQLISVSGTGDKIGLNVGGGCVLLNPGLVNSNPRPALSIVARAGEIRGTSNSGYTANDGFLRLSGGGGTNTNVISYIDISGGNSNADMDRNIVLGTAGTERMRINATGNTGVASAPTTIATLSVGNIGSGNVPLLLGGATQGLSFTTNAFASGMVYNAYFDGSQYRNIQAGFTGGLSLEASTGDQVFATGSNGFAANAVISLGERLRIERSTGALLPGNTFGNQNIGSSTRPWNEVYAKKMISLNAATSMSTLNTGGLSLNSESVVFPSAFISQTTDNGVTGVMDWGQSFTSTTNNFLTRVDITNGNAVAGVTFTLYTGTNYSGQVLYTTTISLLNGVTSIDIPFVKLTNGSTYCFRVQAPSTMFGRISNGPPDAYIGGDLLSSASAFVNPNWDAVFTLISTPPTGLTIAANNNVGVGTPNPVSNFHLSGGLQLGLTNVSANYTIGARDVMVNLSNSGPITVTFPSLTAAEAGRTIFLIKSGATATVTFANATGITSLANSATGRMAVWLGTTWLVTTLN